MRVDAPTFRRYVGDLCDGLEISFDELSQRIAGDPTRLERELTTPQGPSLGTLAKLANHFDVTLDSLVSCNVDLDWVMSRHLGKVVLPSHYRFAAGSHLRTTLPVLQFVETNWGSALHRFILRELRIAPEVFNDADIRVSIRLLSDVLGVLSRRGFKAVDFQEMGHEVTKVAVNQSIGSRFSGTQDHSEIYERLCDEVSKLYENNFNYRLIRERPSSVTMMVDAKQQMKDAFRSEVIDTRQVCMYRQGVAAAQPGYVGLAHASLRELACVHYGDDACIYELSW